MINLLKDQLFIVLNCVISADHCFCLLTFVALETVCRYVPKDTRRFPWMNHDEGPRMCPPLHVWFCHIRLDVFSCFFLPFFNLFEPLFL